MLIFIVKINFLWNAKQCLFQILLPIFFPKDVLRKSKIHKILDKYIILFLFTNVR